MRVVDVSHGRAEKRDLSAGERGSRGDTGDLKRERARARVREARRPPQRRVAHLEKAVKRRWAGPNSEANLLRVCAKGEEGPSRGRFRKGERREREKSEVTREARSALADV